MKVFVVREDGTEVDQVKHTKIFVIMAKGTEVDHSGKVMFDSKGEWTPHKIHMEEYNEIMAYTTKEEADWHKGQLEAGARYFGYKCEYKIVEATLEL
mgnify:CR=1 FL=1